MTDCFRFRLHCRGRRHEAKIKSGGIMGVKKEEEMGAISRLESSGQRLKAFAC